MVAISRQGFTKRRSIAVLAGAAAVSAFASVQSAHATVTVDGSLDSDYGSAIAVQANPTAFGTSSGSTPTYAGGSELDAGYGVVENSTLYIFLAGDLQTNNNKLDIFIQAGPGGTNTLGSITPNDGNFSNMTGMKFDPGFAPTTWLSLGSGGTSLYVDYANLVAGTGAYAGSNGPTPSGFVGPLTGGDVTTPASLQAALNDSNNTGAVADNAVTTGAEVAISLADLGYTSGNIQVSAFVNGGNQDYLSNQVLGPFGSGQGNPGGDGVGDYNGTTGGINFGSFAGTHEFTVTVPSPVPEPASMGLLGGLAVMLLNRRRNRIS